MSDLESETSRRPPRSEKPSTVRTVTAEPLPRGRPSDGLLQVFAGDAATEALALAVAIPFLFLHATYQPTLSLGVGSTSIDATLADVASALADRGIRVIVAGLDQDYRGKPFEPMPQLMAIAEYVDKMLAICMQCGAPANRTYRLVSSNDRVVIGGAHAYEARCRRCFTPPAA